MGLPSVTKRLFKGVYPPGLFGTKLKKMPYGMLIQLFQFLFLVSIFILGSTLSNYLTSVLYVQLVDWFLNYFGSLIIYLVYIFICYLLFLCIITIINLILQRYVRRNGLTFNFVWSPRCRPCKTWFCYCLCFLSCKGYKANTCFWIQ